MGEDSKEVMFPNKTYMFNSGFFVLFCCCLFRTFHEPCYIRGYICCKQHYNKINKIINNNNYQYQRIILKLMNFCKIFYISNVSDEVDLRPSCSFIRLMGLYQIL